MIVRKVHVKAKCGVKDKCLILSFDYKSYNAKVYKRY